MLVLDCRCCNMPVRLNKQRFAELFDADERPLCGECRRLRVHLVEWSAFDMSRGTEIYNRLRTLADKAGAALFERVKLATELLANKEWVSALECGGGNYDTALERVQDHCFPEAALLGKSLGQLLGLYKQFPDESAWKKHKYNLNRLWIDYEKATRPVQPVATESANGLQATNPAAVRRPTVKQVLELTEKTAETEVRLARSEETIDELRCENGRLREENAELRCKVARLEGRIEELERQTSLAVAG